MFVMQHLSLHIEYFFTYYSMQDSSTPVQLYSHSFCKKIGGNNLGYDWTIMAFVILSRYFSLLLSKPYKVSVLKDHDLISQSSDMMVELFL